MKVLGSVILFVAAGCCLTDAQGWHSGASFLPRRNANYRRSSFGRSLTPQFGSRVSGGSIGNNQVNSFSSSSNTWNSGGNGWGNANVAGRSTVGLNGNSGLGVSGVTTSEETSWSSSGRSGGANGWGNANGISRRNSGSFGNSGLSSSKHGWGQSNVAERSNSFSKSGSSGARGWGGVSFGGKSAGSSRWGQGFGSRSGGVISNGDSSVSSVEIESEDRFENNISIVKPTTIQDVTVTRTVTVDNVNNQFATSTIYNTITQTNVQTEVIGNNVRTVTRTDFQVQPTTVTRTTFSNVLINDVQTQIVTRTVEVGDRQVVTETINEFVTQPFTEYVTQTIYSDAVSGRNVEVTSTIRKNEQQVITQENIVQRTSTYTNVITQDIVQTTFDVITRTIQKTDTKIVRSTIVDGITKTFVNSKFQPFVQWHTLSNTRFQGTNLHVTDTVTLSKNFPQTSVQLFTQTLTFDEVSTFKVPVTHTQREVITTTEIKVVPQVITQIIATQNSVRITSTRPFIDVVTSTITSTNLDVRVVPQIIRNTRTQFVETTVVENLPEFRGGLVYMPRLITTTQTVQDVATRVVVNTNLRTLTLTETDIDTVVSTANVVSIVPVESVRNEQILFRDTITQTEISTFILPVTQTTYIQDTVFSTQFISTELTVTQTRTFHDTSLSTISIRNTVPIATTQTFINTVVSAEYVTDNVFYTNTKIVRSTDLVTRFSSDVIAVTETRTQVRVVPATVVTSNIVPLVETRTIRNVITNTRVTTNTLPITFTQTRRDTVFSTLTSSDIVQVTNSEVVRRTAQEVVVNTDLVSFTITETSEVTLRDTVTSVVVRNEIVPVTDTVVLTRTELETFTSTRHLTRTVVEPVVTISSQVRFSTSTEYRTRQIDTTSVRDVLSTIVVPVTNYITKTEERYITLTSVDVLTSSEIRPILHTQEIKRETVATVSVSITLTNIVPRVVFSSDVLSSTELIVRSTLIPVTSTAIDTQFERKQINNEVTVPVQTSVNRDAQWSAVNTVAIPQPQLVQLTNTVVQKTQVAASDFRSELVQLTETRVIPNIVQQTLQNTVYQSVPVQSVVTNREDFVRVEQAELPVVSTVVLSTTESLSDFQVNQVPITQTNVNVVSRVETIQNTVIVPQVTRQQFFNTDVQKVVLTNTHNIVQTNAFKDDQSSSILRSDAVRYTNTAVQRTQEFRTLTSTSVIPIVQTQTQLTTVTARSLQVSFVTSVENIGEPVLFTRTVTNVVTSTVARDGVEYDDITYTNTQTLMQTSVVTRTQVFRNTQTNTWVTTETVPYTVTSLVVDNGARPVTETEVQWITDTLVTTSVQTVWGDQRTVTITSTLVPQFITRVLTDTRLNTMFMTSTVINTVPIFKTNLVTDSYVVTEYIQGQQVLVGGNVVSSGSNQLVNTGVVSGNSNILSGNSQNIESRFVNLNQGNSWGKQNVNSWNSNSGNVQGLTTRLNQRGNTWGGSKVNEWESTETKVDVNLNQNNNLWGKSNARASTINNADSSWGKSDNDSNLNQRTNTWSSSNSFSSTNGLNSLNQRQTNVNAPTYRRWRRFI